MEADLEKGTWQAEPVPWGSANQGLHVAAGNIEGSEVPNYFLRMGSLCFGVAKLCPMSSMCPMAIHHVWAELGNVSGQRYSAGGQGGASSSIPPASRRSHLPNWSSSEAENRPGTNHPQLRGGKDRTLFSSLISVCGTVPSVWGPVLIPDKDKAAGSPKPGWIHYPDMAWLLRW